MRVFPLSNWTELDVWEYIHRESIPVVSLYFAKEREMLIRGDVLIPLDHPLQLLPEPQSVMCRMRSLGCTYCTGAIRSSAMTVPEIIEELKFFRRSRRLLIYSFVSYDLDRVVLLREGWYWTGDLAYRDDAGFFYFAGRDHDWLRVDGENFASAPVERILQRHPDVVLATVYAVPDPVVGDQVMAAVQLRPGLDALDAEGLSGFLAAQTDLGTKWGPRFVRMSAALPATATNKVLKRSLRAERWNCADPVLWQPDKGGPYRRLHAVDAAASRTPVGGRPM